MRLLATGRPIGGSAGHSPARPVQELARHHVGLARPVLVVQPAARQARHPGGERRGDLELLARGHDLAQGGGRHAALDGGLGEVAQGDEGQEQALDLLALEEGQAAPAGPAAPPRAPAPAWPRRPRPRTSPGRRRRSTAGANCSVRARGGPPSGPAARPAGWRGRRGSCPRPWAGRSSPRCRSRRRGPRRPAAAGSPPSRASASPRSPAPHHGRRRGGPRRRSRGRPRVPAPRSAPPPRRPPA